MTQLGRHFYLSPVPGTGVSCGETGLFVDDVPLLEVNQDQSERWQPRPVSDLSRDLGERYGLPIDCNAKIGGLAAIARALNRGDILHARIVALHLQFPDPPELAKIAHDARGIVELARQLRASGLLKAGWDPRKHPRWPAGTPGSIGGEFAPSGNVPDNSVTEDRNIPVIPTQLPFQPHPTWWSHAKRRSLGRPRSRLRRSRRRMSILLLSHGIPILAGRNA
jgi:hypothetical protein